LDFYDPQQRVPELMRAFDIFALTSRIEGVPTTVMEAMATGLPVVTTDVGAVREVVAEGITGFVVRPADPQAIADAILRLIRDPSLRKSLGESGRERVLSRFSIDACAKAHLEAFGRAIAHHRRPDADDA
jgi:glycosyltransferase involved in cell wall biosynthesis